MESSSVIAVGVWFYSVSTHRYLYLLRNDPRHPDTWGLPGGKIEEGETLIDAITRECVEEMGSMPDYLRLVPVEKFTSADMGFVYHTFFCSVANEFCPQLNNEHNGWAWITSGSWPKPMHPGLWSTLNFDAVRVKIETIEQLVQTSQ
jgi:8-oxo-dGTP pyrophosphatase MutT (NUDIX family)